MFMRPLFALAAFVAAAAATPAFAQCCACTETCPPPPPPSQVQVWGLSPSYGVVQGPVYTGPGYYTGPVYKTEVSTADYPYVGSTDFFDAGPNADPFRNNLYHPYWPMLPGLSMRASRYHPGDAVSARAMVRSPPHARKSVQDGTVR